MTYPVQAKVTSKGQITVPAEVREQLGLGKGDSLVFETKGEYVVVRRAKRIEEVAGCLKEYAQPILSDEEVQEAYARHLAEMDERTKTGGDRSA
jgi:AbrB family looped-hinge helix DNA binding protein